MGLEDLDDVDGEPLNIDATMHDQLLMEINTGASYCHREESTQSPSRRAPGTVVHNIRTTVPPMHKSRERANCDQQWRIALQNYFCTKKAGRPLVHVFTSHSQMILRHRCIRQGHH